MINPTEADLRVARTLVANTFDRHTIKFIEGNVYFRHPIDYYSHDEFSYEDNCEQCGARLPSVDRDALNAVSDCFADQIDAAMAHAKYRS